jgi:hypothetical protein
MEAILGTKVRGLAEIPFGQSILVLGDSLSMLLPLLLSLLLGCVYTAQGASAAALQETTFEDVFRTDLMEILLPRLDLSTAKNLSLTCKHVHAHLSEPYLRWRLSAYIHDSALPEFVRWVARNRPALIREMAPAKFTALFDRLDWDLPNKREDLALLRAAVSGKDQLAELLEGLVRSDGRIWRSDLTAFCSVPEGSDEILTECVALHLLEEAGENLMNPNLLLELLKKGIRFTLSTFVEEVDIKKGQLENVFSLMDCPLWPETALLLHCAYLRGFGRHSLAEAIEGLPQVLQFYDSFRDESFETDQMDISILRKANVSQRLVKKFIPSRH